MASTSRPISRDTAYAPSTLVGSGPSSKPGTAAGESKTQSILEEHDAVAIAMRDLSHLETEPQRLQSLDGLEHVDVLGAEAAFAELSRKLSRQFTQENEDVESQGSDGTSTVFDLREVMQRVQTERSREGAKRKRVHVVWHNLTVKGIAQIDLHPPSFMDALLAHIAYPYVLAKRLKAAKQAGTRNLLDHFDGSLRAGEMCLVLGRPGSGCSTFLKTIANQRQGFLSVEGDVKYNSLDAVDFARTYKGEAIHIQEDDPHLATLTVRQTLDFALSLKTPGRLPEGMTAKQWRSEVLSVLLSMFAIKHTANTLVGSTTIRGVSGGERKRVSIAEGLTTRMAVASFDNATRGLDAATALDYAKSVRVLTDVLELSTFVSLYQAGEGIWEQFDKVLVIDQGHLVYFGPRDQARAYFHGLGFAEMPRQTSADYVTGCTDASVRRFAPGHDKRNTPTTPRQLERAYRQSSIYARAMEEREKVEIEVALNRSLENEFKEVVIEAKHKGVRHTTPYVVSFLRQVAALTQRQMWVNLGNRLDLYCSLVTNVVLGIIIGTIFLKLPSTSDGAFARGGVIFIALLFNSISAFAELPTQMSGRPILYKQQGFALYRASAVPLAQLIADIPLALVRVVLFSTIVWLLALLKAHQEADISSAYIAGRYFFFLASVFISYLAMSSLFRLFGTICTSYNLASKAAAVVISVMVNFSGYLTPRPDMKGWLRWISYINPLFCSFSGLAISEYRSLPLRCTANQIAPRNPPWNPNAYPSVPQYQTCTLAGARPGSDLVVGADYLKASFDYDVSDMWLNFGVLAAFFVGFVAASCVAIEVLNHGSFSSAIVVKKKATKEEVELDRRLQERRKARPGTATARDEAAAAPLTMTSKPFTWRNLNYNIGRLQLLNKVDGYSEPGKFTALMGASGAGKTTLLDVLADRKSVGVITGERLIAGSPVDVSFQRKCGFAEQFGVDEPTATVREALRFSAYLRQPADVPIEEKNAYVEELISVLGMESIANAVIGTPEWGLGLSDRKRLTIGVELASKPAELLFLDEPTTGLDGQSAYNLVLHLRKLAAAGQSIVCTIHQPSSLLFETFDRLLLLQRGGEVVYFGDIGRNSSEVVKYFADHGAPMPATANPAEEMLEIIGAGSSRRVGPRDWADVYRDSDLYQRNLRRIEELNGQQARGTGDGTVAREYATPFWTQLKHTLIRASRSSWRQPDYQFIRLFQHAAIALTAGLLWLQLGNTGTDLQYRIFDLFVLTVLPALILAAIEPMYLHARSVFQREWTSRTYSPQVFALSQVIAELPYCLACAIVYWAINFFMTFYNADVRDYSVSRGGYMFAMILVEEVFATTLGQFIGAVAPNMFIASLTTPFLATWFALLCGSAIPRAAMPAFYREFAIWINPMYYLVSGLTVNELAGLPVRCSQRELYRFALPSNMSSTCGEYARDFVGAYGGYIVDESVTQGECEYCRYAMGTDFLTTLGLKVSEKGRDAGVFIAFTALNVVAVVVAQRYVRYANR